MKRKSIPVRKNRRATNSIAAKDALLRQILEEILARQTAAIRSDD